MESDSTEQSVSSANEMLSVDQQKAETLAASDAHDVAPLASSIAGNEEASDCCLEGPEPTVSRWQQEAGETYTVGAGGLQGVTFGQDRLGVVDGSGLCHLKSLLDAQRDRILEQLQQLQKVVVLQCRITGTNPLAQEMGSMVLGKGIGKKFGDSLTPKAMKCLYNVFSIKDTITKKEAREISALCGATVTQVREFFAGQRSRVRKVVHSSLLDQRGDGIGLQMQSTQLEKPTFIGLPCGVDPPGSCSELVADSQINHLALLDTFCGKADGIASKLYAVEKAEHLINIMHKESTFTGQSQLAQVIMQAHDAVLRGFMARGGLQQIIRWLIQAATEEQTSLIRIILKAVARLPLGSASPRHMSLLLQTVNRLRFYRAQDVAGRARLLLSRWSRFCKSTQGGKLASSAGLARSSQLGQKRSRDCIHSNTLDDTSKKKTKLDCKQASDALFSSVREDTSVPDRQKAQPVAETVNPRKRLGGLLVQADRAKEKRKVQLFEECRAVSRRRDGEGTKPSTFDSSSRPLSADDIKKAKRRAFFLSCAKSEKHSISTPNGSLSLDLSTSSFEKAQKPISGNLVFRSSQQELSLRENVCPGEVTDSLEAKTLSSSQFLVQSDEPVEFEIQNKMDPGSLGSRVCVGQSVSAANETEMDMVPSIQWAFPAGLSLDFNWKIATGDESTEAQFETRRESTVLEAIYPSAHCIPSSPAEPAERLCLFVDDSLVPELLLESIDEESMERDCSLQSPRDAEIAELHTGEADSHKLGVMCVNSDTDLPQPSLTSTAETNRLEIPSEGMYSMGGNESQQFSFGLAQSDGFMPIGKVNVTADVVSTCAVPSLPALTLASTTDHTSVELTNTEVTVADTDEQTSSSYFTHLGSVEANPVLEEQVFFSPSTTGQSSTLEISQPLVASEENSKLGQNSQDVLKKTIPVAASAEISTLPDPVVTSNSQIYTSGVDLSELSKETCLDMLNIVLQQLADNAKSSGADLELLSVFLKNPQLVYSLMSSQPESGNGLPATGGSLSESVPSGTLGSLGCQLEELMGRNIGQVAISVKELANSGFNVSETRQAVTRPPSITRAGSPSHLLVSSSIRQPHEAIEPINESSNSQSRPTNNSQHFLNQSSLLENSSSRSLDYDWSQPYEYTPENIQQGLEAARQSVPSRATKDGTLSNHAYSQSLAGYAPSYPVRTSELLSSMSLLDQRLQSSLSMHVSGKGHHSPSMTSAQRQEEKATNMRNGFCTADTPANHVPLKAFARTVGISDGLLPVPDTAANSSRAQTGRVMHESHAVHGGTLPTFPSVSPAVGHHVPHRFTNGVYHNEQSIKQPSLPSSQSTYLPNGRNTFSFIPSPFRSQGGLDTWRPPASHSTRPRHIRPGWREC